MRTERTELRGEARRVAERVRELLDQHQTRAGASDVEAQNGAQDTTRVAGAGGWSRVSGSTDDDNDASTKPFPGNAKPSDDGDRAWSEGPEAPGRMGAEAAWSAGNVAPWRAESAAAWQTEGAAPWRAESAASGSWVDDNASGGDEPGEYEYRAPSGRTPAWRRVLARLPVRADPGRRGALAIGVAVLLAAVVTGVWLMSQRPRSMPVSAVAPSVPGSSPLVGSDSVVTSGSTAAPAGGATPGATSGADVVVDVAGKVREPGLYRLAPGSRIDDALTAAGGPLSGVRLDSLNLAAMVVDGQQIVVGLPGAAATQAVAAPGDPAAGGSATFAPVSLNSATLEQLETLPGVGPVMGQKILDWRSAHGSFTSIDQLNDISGIGDITFKEISPLVTL